MGYYLDKVIKADQCAQYVDDIGIAANDAQQIINNLRATCWCIQKAGVKLTRHKCHFGATEIVFLGRTITPAGAKPQIPRIQNFLENMKFPKSKKALQRYLGSSKLHPMALRKTQAIFQTLTKCEKVLDTQDLLEKITEMNKVLD